MERDISEFRKDLDEETPASLHAEGGSAKRGSPDDASETEEDEMLEDDAPKAEKYNANGQSTAPRPRPSQGLGGRSLYDRA
jgi:hypothetical protein